MIQRLSGSHTVLENGKSKEHGTSILLFPRLQREVGKVKMKTFSHEGAKHVGCLAL
jgi:hypothetical protein